MLNFPSKGETLNNYSFAVTSIIGCDGNSFSVIAIIFRQ